MRFGLIECRRVAELVFPVIAVHIVAVAPAQGRTFGHSDPESIVVPFALILASPSDYQGQRVRTYGVATFGFETTGLYLNHDRMEQGIAADAVWLDISIPDLTLQDLEPLSGRYVAIEGRVNADNRGHRGAYVAALDDVNLIGDSQMSEPIQLTDRSAYLDAYAGAFVAARDLVEAAGFDAGEMHLSFLCESNVCEFAVYPAALDEEGSADQRGCPAEYYCADLEYDFAAQRFTKIVHWR